MLCDEFLLFVPLHVAKTLLYQQEHSKVGIAGRHITSFRVLVIGDEMLLN
jgi:hypothetical protein